MGRVISKRTDLKRHARGSPARMHAGRERVKLMVNVNCEIEQPAGHENPRQLTDNLPRRLGMINYVIAEHHIKTLIRKRQRLTNRCYRLRASLPARKQTSITDAQRIDTDSVFRSKVEDEPVGATANLNYTRVSFDRLKRLEPLTHLYCGSHHRGN